MGAGLFPSESPTKNFHVPKIKMAECEGSIFESASKVESPRR